ncbi:hypothetical protein HNQ40_001172 [Algisphaera agarilytica]|uniref:Uncharacterized protein n=1 Tax=Algisphaera agarilytica TaxID=1385975 RepID=A0A7X0H760_9BACT|nr:hypothetical protein [Algisphaera agarilytica]
MPDLQAPLHAQPKPLSPQHPTPNCQRANARPSVDARIGPRAHQLTINRRPRPACWGWLRDYAVVHRVCCRQGGSPTNAETPALQDASPALPTRPARQSLPATAPPPSGADSYSPPTRDAARPQCARRRRASCPTVRKPCNHLQMIEWTESIFLCVVGARPCAPQRRFNPLPRPHDTPRQTGTTTCRRCRSR